MSVASTQLSRTWLYAITMAIIFFISFELFIGMHSRFGYQPLCRIDIEFSLWSWYINCGQAGGFCTTLLILMIKAIRSRLKGHGQFVIYLPTLVVVALGASSSLLTLVNNWGGICEDTFGVSLPAAMWGEWLCGGTLLVYIVTAMDEKPSFSPGDLQFMASFFLSILFAFFTIFKQPFGLACVWLACSCLSYSIVIYTQLKLKDEFNNALREISMDAVAYKFHVELASLKLQLGTALFFLFPFNVFVYFLALVGAIDRDYTRSLLQLADMTTKCVFAALVMDSQHDMLNPAAMDLINMKINNENRREFIKFVFHEIRVPLNSISMGIDVFGKCDTLDATEKISLQLMSEAATNMGKTLNDVLDMQKIEDGALELTFRPFKVRVLVKNVMKTFETEAKDKILTIVADVQTSVPVTLIGDGVKIGIALTNILNNAVKFSPKNSSVLVKVQICSGFPWLFCSHVCKLAFSVADQGMGISETDQARLFEACTQLRSGEQQTDRGVGLGLAVSRQIITLHGGRLSCDSAPGEGSTFAFTIPFEVCYSNAVQPSDEFIDLGNVRDLVKEICEARGSNNKATRSATKYQVAPPHSLEAGQTDGMLRSDFKSHKLLASDIEDTLDEVIIPPDNYMDEMSQSLAAPLRAIARRLSSASAKSGPAAISRGNSSFSLAFSDKTYPRPRVLVVDDVLSNRKMLQILLSKEDVLADMAEDGQLAVNAIISNGLTYYDIVFMDNIMPNLTGPKAATKLRGLGFANLIIGITACAMDDDIATYLTAGADLVLPKPLKLADLHLILEYGVSSGYATKPDMTLIMDPEGLYWAPLGCSIARNPNKIYLNKNGKAM